MPRRSHGVRIGIQPTCWTNDDFPEIGNQYPYQFILDQTAEAGYEGGSTGHNYPTHVPSLVHTLQSRRLGITSTWVGTEFTVPGRFDATLEFVRAQIAFLKAVGANDIVVAELGAAVNQVRVKSVLEDRPIFNEPQWYLLTIGLNEAGRLAREEGMQLSFHPHVGTGVQNRQEIDRLFDETDADLVGLCLDTAHAKFAHVDPIRLALDYAERITHVHLKDVRPRVLEKAVPGRYSFYRAIREGIFTVPGDPEGGIDFRPIFDALRRRNYQGWMVVEAEQDPAMAEPLRYAHIARRYIRENFGY
ncbi:myo-inosose-2 dehydratase [Singulisphaera sp. GP187]|uniref:myo-inosose-2 dehydratase n=1 Tax=Singulisphaera sp. GP187 TaxID=1882752 RepID=UPI00135658D2|nr:myo-inosose-2 dehydratase [Singulisphaera sp. GP187]